GIGDIARMFGLCLWPGDGTVAGRIGPAAGAVYDRFWNPFVTAVLNTAPSEASARLAGRTLAAIAAQGEAGFRPCVARQGLGPALVEPALKHLGERGIAIGYGRRLRGLELSAGRVARLLFEGGSITLGA